jgi:hypothetical protein
MKINIEIKTIRPPMVAPHPQGINETDEEYDARFKQTKDYVYLRAKVTSNDLVPVTAKKGLYAEYSQTLHSVKFPPCQIEEQKYEFFRQILPIFGDGLAYLYDE